MGIEGSTKKLDGISTGNTGSFQPDQFVVEIGNYDVYQASNFLVSTKKTATYSNLV